MEDHYFVTKVDERWAVCTWYSEDEEEGSPFGAYTILEYFDNEKVAQQVARNLNEDHHAQVSFR